MPQFKIPPDLKKNKFFSGLSDSLLNSIYDPRELKENREGEIIYRTGDESTAIYLLISGEVRVKYSSNNYVSGKDASSFFGEKEIIDNTRRISSAVAFSRVIYYRIDKNVFKKVISKNSVAYNNIMNFGELNLPEVSKDTERKFNIVEKARPISFKATSDITNSEEKDKKQKEKPAVSTNPEVDHFVQEPEDNNIENYLTPDDLSQKLEKELQANSVDLTDDSIVDSTSQKPAPNVEKDISAEKKTSIPQVEETPQQSKQVEISEKENGINREIVRKVFTSIEIIYGSVTVTDLIEKTVKALKDLTVSENGNLILIDEKLSLMKKFITENKQIKEEHFQLPEGLTGSCALQKKILNFERPTEDSRYLAKIDQPGAARLKRILYFPIINESGETIAVIQLARENKKFSDQDISYLNMLSKQIVSAIERAYNLEEYVTNERAKSNSKLREILLNEIRDPINIINSYAEILSDKKLSEEIDEVIRMLQKQANSIEDLTDTFLNSSSDSFALEFRDIHFNEFIEDVLELLSEYCQARDVTLFKKIGDGTIVNIDRGKFYSALLQIIKYCCADASKSGKIYLSTELRDNSIVTTIKGEGKGSLQNLDGEFSTNLLRKNNLDNTHLQLLLAKKIISSHNGQFELNSIKGKETTFVLTLPISNSSLN